MHLIEITDYKSQVYSDAITILHNSIAKEAQLPEKRFRDLLVARNYQLFAYVDDEDVQGVALIYFASTGHFAWLDYFAIRDDLRGRGLGGALFREIVQVVKSRTERPDWLLLEVDDEREGDAQHRATCMRRLEFYQRLGARVLQNVPYKFPSAFAPPLPMRLMAKPLQPHAQQLSADQLKRAVREVFTNIHGRSGSDELLRWFEENLPEAIELK